MQTNQTNRWYKKILPLNDESDQRPGERGETPQFQVQTMSVSRSLNDDELLSRVGLAPHPFVSGGEPCERGWGSRDGLLEWRRLITIVLKQNPYCKTKRYI